MTISAPMTITWRGDALLANFRFSAHSSYRRPRARSRAQGYPRVVDISVLNGQQFCSALPLDRSSGDFSLASRSSGLGRHSGSRL